MRSCQARLAFLRCSSHRNLFTTRAIHTVPIKAPTSLTSLFCFTSGRWLWNEETQLRSRYRPFDVLSLQQIAAQAVGSASCVSIEKIGEGNCNKAYRLVMEDGQKVVAKIPHPNAGPSILTTASEVATMEFARDVLGLPVPEVLTWDASDNNPVGVEYIIMEEAYGTPLHEAWKNLQLRAKCDVLNKVVDVEKKLLSLSFSKVGSIYFSDGHVPGCEPVTITLGSQEIDEHIRSRFCIGPIVRREFWEKERKDMHQYHGPWNSSMEYLESIAQREIEWIENHADPSTRDRRSYEFTSEYDSFKAAHIAAMRKLLSIIPAIVPKDTEITSSRLWHPDFHPGNIYIGDDGQISSVIDWQGAWATPIIIGANPPLLLDYGTEILMKLPDNFKQLDDTTKARLRHQVSESILITSYETSTSKQNPLMYKMMRHPHGQTLKQLEAFAGSTWDNNLFPLEECLIRVEREWDHFNTDRPCPYRFSTTEIRNHSQEVDSFNEHQEFWRRLRGIVTHEGYVPNEGYDEAIESLQRAL